MVKTKSGLTDDDPDKGSDVFINDPFMAEDDDDIKAEIDRLNPSRNIGPAIMFAVAILMLVGIGIPVIAIYYLNSPLPDQHLFILGISYFKLVLIFFISSAILVYSSFFFLSLRPSIIIPVFLFALFCCFPFIMGLKNNLTLMGTILNQQFFSSWPFFLKPTYLFFELFVPLGVAFYLILQLNNMMGKKKSSYAFICIALYLCISVYIGTSLLRQTGQPSLPSIMFPKIKTIVMSSTSYITNKLADKESAISRGNTSSEGNFKSSPDIDTQPRLDTAQEISDSVFIYPVRTTQEIKSEPETPPIIDTLPETPPIIDPLPDQQLTVGINLKQEFERIHIQADLILDLISKLELSLPENDPGNDDEMKNPSSGDTDHTFNELKSILNKTSNLNPEDEKMLSDIEKELKALSNGLEVILKSISADGAEQIN